jgi:methionyl-tRNA synthetase
MKYYITTPIYYVNAAPHIGHTYTTIAADTIKRFKIMQGFDARLTTGTDEHGLKVERSAEASGRTPKEFADVVSAEFRAQWDSLGISYDYFQRTTSPQHHETVRRLFQRCLDNGYIYKGGYTGQYCVSDELYVNEAGPGDACPICGRITETVTEENYFFKLSAFADKLLALYESEPLFVQPDARRNEVLSFVRQGLQDLSISRTTVKWGVPLPVEGEHVFYVWFDALTTYMSAVRDAGLWPADLHLIGKEIVRFHAVFWPAFLMAAGLPLPKRIYAHGWLLFENDKMSKSRGNIVRTEPIRRVMGIDGLRYFLLREIVFGQDGGFSYDALVSRYNSDLANGLGNLVNRTLTMVKQYRGGVVPARFDQAVGKVAAQTVETAVACFDRFDFSRGLEAIWQLLAAADKFIVEQAPWKLARATDEASQQQLDAALGTAAETVRVATGLLSPVLPESAAKIWSQLGMPGALGELRLADLAWGGYPENQAIGEIAAVFPRLDAAVAIEQMRALELEVGAAQAKLIGTPEPEPGATAPAIAPIAAAIRIEDFSKVDLRVGVVLSAEPVKGADKLLHLKVDIGESEPRTIVAGIAQVYRPEQVMGRKVVIVANLEPRKLRGIVSQGMIVAASADGGTPVLAGFLEDVPIGARLK